MSITVNAVHRRVQYTGNGSNLGPFSFSFKVLAAGDIKVSEGATEKTVTTHYTTSLNADGTGSVTFTAGNAPANGAIVTIESDQAIERTTDYSTGGDFTAASINDALDRLTINDQQIETLLSRNIQLPATVNRTTSGTGTSGPLFFPYADTASDQASKLIAYDSNGTALETTTGRVNTVAVSNVAVDGSGNSQDATVSFNSSTGALSLGVPVGSTGATGATGAAGADGVFSEVADQSEAEAGTNNTKGMTPLRVKQAVDNYGLLAANDLSDLANAATARTNLGVSIGTDVQAFDADNLTADVSDNLTAGFSSDFEAIGNSGTGTQTLEISSSKENLKTITINGSFTLAPQTVNSVIALIATNDGTGGYTITTSGFDLVSGTYNNAASAKHLFRSTVIDGTQVLEILEIA